MMKKFLSAWVFATSLGLSSAQAAPVSIDFNTYADGVALSSVGDVSFSLAGGPGVVGTPTIGLHSYGEGGLINSTLGAPGYINGYPTTNILAFTFAHVVSGISVKLWEASPVTWTAYAVDNSVIASGAFGFNGVHALGGTGVKSLVLNNNQGNGNWVFSVAELHYDVSPVPEPETFALLLAGLGVVGVVARRRKMSDESSC
jgi:hypothetical protein